MILNELMSFEKNECQKILYPKSYLNIYTIFLEQCFGGFATGVREDENGNLIQVCFCKGQQCNKYLL